VSDGRKVAVELLGENAVQKLEQGAKYLVVIGDRTVSPACLELLQNFLKKGLDIEAVVLQADDVSIFELTN